MKLYFTRSAGDERLIGEPLNEDQATVMINNFLKEHNYKSYKRYPLCFSIGKRSDYCFRMEIK